MASTFLGHHPANLRTRSRGCSFPLGRDGTLCRMHTSTSSTDLARQLDREADAELHAGHVGAAERLAHQAAELRGVAA